MESKSLSAELSRITIDMPTNLQIELKALAAMNGLSMRTIVIKAIEKHLQCLPITTYSDQYFFDILQDTHELMAELHDMQMLMETIDAYNSPNFTIYYRPEEDAPFKFYIPNRVNEKLESIKIQRKEISERLKEKLKSL